MLCEKIYNNQKLDIYFLNHFNGFKVKNSFTAVAAAAGGLAAVTTTGLAAAEVSTVVDPGAAGGVGVPEGVATATDGTVGETDT